MTDLQHVAVGTWSGGRFMHFGEPVDDARLEALLRPGDGIATLLTADTYGAGEADRLLGRALAGVPRDDYALVGAIGHDFYTGERRGAKGYPRFTDPALRGPDGYADYVRMAAERSLERCGADSFDLLLLHNPDRTADRGQARRARRAAERGPALRRGGGRDPRDRRQHRLHGAQGRRARPRGRTAPGPLAARRAARPRRAALGHRAGAR